MARAARRGMRQDQAQKAAAAAAFGALLSIASIGWIGSIGACNTEPSAKHGGSPEITIPQPHAKAPTISPQDVRGADIPGPNPEPSIRLTTQGEDGGAATEPERGDAGASTEMERGDAGIHEMQQHHQKMHHHHADGGT